MFLSKLEDAKPGDSAMSYNELYQNGVVVGETAGRDHISSRQRRAASLLLFALYITYRLHQSSFLYDCGSK